MTPQLAWMNRLGQAVILVGVSAVVGLVMTLLRWAGMSMTGASLPSNVGLGAAWCVTSLGWCVALSLFVAIAEVRDLVRHDANGLSRSEAWDAARTCALLAVVAALALWAVIESLSRSDA